MRQYIYIVRGTLLEAPIDFNFGIVGPEQVKSVFSKDFSSKSPRF